MKPPEICKYCGGIVRLIPASAVYGDATQRLGLAHEFVYQCQNCNARVGCHKGTTRPLGDVANEGLRLKRMETHRVFDTFWKRRHMTRSNAYKWLSEQLDIPREEVHIGGFEMDTCEKLIRLCREYENQSYKDKQAKKENQNEQSVRTPPIQLF